MTRENASPEAAAKVLWHSLGPEAVLDLLKTDPAKGLDGAEASKRRERYGPNALESGKRPAWYALFARQFTDALVIILMVAAAAALALGETADAVTILAIVVLNGVLGFAQEWKAENAIEALKRMLSPRCRVVRDGVEKEIDSSEVVPGDMVVLETGARVPADIRLIETVNLKADESSLTGESESVDKGATAVDGDAALPERGSMAWAGTVITSGRGMGAVVATGMESEFGRIARLTGAVAAEKTPFQKKLASLGKWLGALSLAVSAAVAASGLLLGKPLFEMFLVGVSLAVAVVPEGLPAVVTVTLALGIRSWCGGRPS